MPPAATRDGDGALTDALLLSKLDTSDFSNIHTLFSTFLLPFSHLTNPKPKKPSKSKTASKSTADVSADVTEVRSLTKRFLPFLNKSLSTIPRLLLSDQKPSQTENENLLTAYETCLTCLETVAPHLACKPWFVLAQRARLMQCMDACGRHVAAEVEGLSLLKKISCFDQGGVRTGFGGKRRIVPDVVESGSGSGSGSVDCELAVLVVEIVVTVVKCGCLREECADEEVYRRLVRLVGESRVWFRSVVC